jgi:hypothetical protein
LALEILDAARTDLLAAFDFSNLKEHGQKPPSFENLGG